jgi:hypothetical protein
VRRQVGVGWACGAGAIAIGASVREGGFDRRDTNPMSREKRRSLVPHWTGSRPTGRVDSVAVEVCASGGSFGRRDINPL